MFGFRKRPARNRLAPMPAEIAEEVLALCRQEQLDQLKLPAHLRRDVGFDCGCIEPDPGPRRPFLL